MEIGKIYAIERAKWDVVAKEKSSRQGIIPVQGGDNFLDYARRSSTHTGVADFLGDLREKRVLEFGCGTGQMTALLAKSGAHVTAFDISAESIRISRERARVNEVTDRVDLAVCAGESLPFASDSFDVLYGKAVLHHLSASLAQTELYRMLKPGGKGVFVEPMGTNPLVEFARDHLPYPDKNPCGVDIPLSYEDIYAWGRSFKDYSFREIQLVSMVRRAFGIKGGQRTLTRIDDWLLKKLPGLKPYCRYVVLTMVK